MFEWTDDAIVLGARAHGENGAVVEAFSRAHGRSAGYVHGGFSRKMQPVLQVGNVVRATWKARTGDQLGHFAPIELLEPHAAALMGSSGALSALASAVALVRAGTAERQANTALFDAFAMLVPALAEPQVAPALYVRFEIGLLAAIGYGLDLTRCALTGETEDLAFVSPKTGRAASATAGAPYAERLLRLSPFLVDPTAPIESGDVADAFALAGWFLERRVFDQQGVGMPDVRRRLIETWGREGRL
jgi:DNA repair protein RecO (recombination protein O)